MRSCRYEVDTSVDWGLMDAGLLGTCELSMGSVSGIEIDGVG